jgi:quercetin dioxygenase-like cupin family protein
MPILRFSDAVADPGDPGVLARRMVNAAMGSRTITCGVSVFEPGSAIFTHTHPCEEVVAIVDGQGVAEVNGERFVLRPFDLSFMPPLVPHRFINESARPFTMIYFYPTTEVSRDAVDPDEATAGQKPHN